MAVLWSLWLAQNDRIFNRALSNPEGIFLLAKKRAFEWCNLANIIPHQSANIWACHPKSTAHFVQVQKKERFLAILRHKYEIIAFIDGAYFPNHAQLYKGGVGGVVYDNSKELAFLFFGPCEGLNIEDIELESMLYVSLKISINWPGRYAVVCSDSSTAVKKFQEFKLGSIRVRSPVLGSSIENVDLNNIWACKISRLWNKETDFLAKQGVKKSHIVEGFL